MKSKLIKSFALVVCLLAVGSPLFAHHGSVAYDNSKVVTLKDGVVTKVNWANPHVLVMFDVKGGDGNMQHWVVEAGSPSAVSGQGWTNTTIEPATSSPLTCSKSRPAERSGAWASWFSPTASHSVPSSWEEIARLIAMRNRSTAATKRRLAVPTAKRPATRSKAGAFRAPEVKRCRADRLVRCVAWSGHCSLQTRQWD